MAWHGMQAVEARLVNVSERVGGVRPRPWPPPDEHLSERFECGRASE